MQMRNLIPELSQIDFGDSQLFTLDLLHHIDRRHEVLPLCFRQVCHFSHMLLPDHPCITGKGAVCDGQYLQPCARPEQLIGRQGAQGASGGAHAG